MAGKQSNLTRLLKNAAIASAAACLAVLLVGTVWTRLNTHQHVVVFRLAPDAGQLDAAALRDAASVVRKRAAAVARKFALADVEVETEGPDRLRMSFQTHSSPRDVEEMLAWVGMHGRADFCLLHPRDGSLGILEPGVEVRDRMTDVPEGYVLRTYREKLYRLSRPGETVTRRHLYLVRARPVLTVNGFARVHFATAGWQKKSLVTFEFGGGQAEEFRQATALNVGRQMILLIDGYAFFPPREIQSAIGGGRVQIEGYFYNPPLRILVKMLQSGAMPGRLEQLSHEVE
ncbi:MAG: hypothetical protein QGH74_04870 [Candidatus Brocadiia bacterium]|nr:hypothetical protein [Candidatus Brocadiia bacterium]